VVAVYLEDGVVLVLAERWQIAPKLHAISEQFSDARENLASGISSTCSCYRRSTLTW
jgi:hypothetical protein